MLNGMIRMKEMIQKLKEYGYLGHLESEYTQRCSSKHLEQLNEMTQDLEITLVGWIKYVWNCRHKYYQLNFYTTKQLITLRKEITQIRNDKNKSEEINPHMFHLLQSVIGKPDKSSMLIRRALENEEDLATEDKEETIISQTQITESPVIERDMKLPMLQKEISTLNQEQKQLFEELKKQSFHDDHLLLEAVLNPDCCSDFSTAMIWCNAMSLEDDFLEEIRHKWEVNITNENITEELKQPAPEQHTLENVDNSTFSMIADAFIPFNSIVYQTRFVSTFLHSSDY